MKRRVFSGWLILLAIFLTACADKPPEPTAIVHENVIPPTIAPALVRTLPPTSPPISTWTPAPSPTPQPTHTMLPINETRYINATIDRVNLRGGAGVTFDVVGSLANGSEINVIGKQTTSDGFLWYELVYGSRTAWIYGELTSRTPPYGQGFVLPSPIPAPGFCTCSGQDLDCANFSNRASAQACYNKCMMQVGSDVYRLDGDDNDGRVCERLP